LKEDFRGAWPDRFPWEYVNKQYQKAVKTGKVDNFNQELMLRIMSDEDRLITDGDINWYSRDKLLVNRGMFNYYITTDFATSEKAAADFSVISVWALNHKGYWFWVDGICKKQTMDQNINDLFRLAQKWEPQAVGIEVSGQQGGFMPWIQQEMMTRNCFFNLASENNNKKPGIKPNTNKMVRFNVVVPWFKSNQMFFPYELKEEGPMLECMNELKLIAAGGIKSKHDDFIDTISMLASLQTWRPSGEQPMKKDESGVWDMEEEDDASAMSSYIV
jgi:predicted phage terminase large subunit-like protein